VRDIARRHLILPLALALAGPLGAPAISSAFPSTGWPVPTLVPTLGAEVSPGKLPANEYVPVTWTIFGKVGTNDGTHPSALREAVVDIDKDVRLNAEGFPVCGPGRLDGLGTKAARRACRDAFLGEGEAHLEIAKPAKAPVVSSRRLLVFNGGKETAAPLRADYSPCSKVCW
jgi:hypothetical protein